MLLFTKEKFQTQLTRAPHKKSALTRKEFMKTILTFVLAFIANVTQAQTNTPATPAKTFVTNTIIGKKFVWEQVAEVGTTNTAIRQVDEVSTTIANNNRPPKVKKAKANKNAPPPVFVVRSETNSSSQVYYYGQYATNRYGTGPGEVQPQAPGSIQWTGSAQPAGGAQNYVVDQRPLDQGAQPTSAVAHYPTYQGNYATAPATYPVQSTYPVYPEYGSYYPVAHYPTYGYSYPTYGYEYPAYGYGAGYVSQRRLFGVSFGAVVSPAYSYEPGWVARGGHGHYQSHQATYPTYHSGGHYQSHQATYPTYGDR